MYDDNNVRKIQLSISQEKAAGLHCYNNQVIVSS